MSGSGVKMTVVKCLLCDNRASHAWVISTNSAGWDKQGVSLQNGAVAWCLDCNFSVATPLGKTLIESALSRAKLIQERARGVIQESEDTQEDLLSDSTIWFHEFCRKGF